MSSVKKTSKWTNKDRLGYGAGWSDPLISNVLKIFKTNCTLKFNYIEITVWNI